MNIGHAIATVRKAQKLTQYDVAVRAHTHTSTVSLIERGKRTPKLATINHIADVLNVSPLLLYHLALAKDERDKLPAHLLARLDNWASETLAELAWEEEDE